MQPLACDLWLIEPNALRQFVGLAGARFNMSLEEVRSSRPQAGRQKSIAVVPVHGVLEARASLIGEFLGMTSYEAVGNMFDMAMADESVGGIVLDVMSPGGMAYGAPELAQKIYSARGVKPIIAVANHVAASGAYWLAAAADRLAMTPSGDVGSVGVIAEHVSFSKAAESQGLEVSVFRSDAAPYKAESNDMEPLTDEARKNIQSRVNEIHGNFVADLARFRGVSVDYVNENFGKGRVVSAKQAIKSGMVDYVGTLHDIAMKLATGRIRIGGNRTEDDWNAPTVQELRRSQAAELRAMSAGEIPLVK